MRTYAGTDAATPPRPPQLDRRLVPPPGGADLAHAHRRRADLPGAATAVRRLPQPRPQPAAPGAALPAEAGHAAARVRTAAVGRRSRLQHRVPRAPHRAAGAGQRGAAVPADLADRLPAARPRQAAVGELAGRGARGRPVRGDLEDPPLARRRRLRGRSRDRDVRSRARSAGPAGGSRTVAAPARAVVGRARRRGCARDARHDRRDHDPGGVRGHPPRELVPQAPGRRRGRRRDRLGRAQSRPGDAAERRDRSRTAGMRSFATSSPTTRGSRTPSGARSTTSC